MVRSQRDLSPVGQAEVMPEDTPQDPFARPERPQQPATERPATGWHGAGAPSDPWRRPEPVPAGVADGGTAVDAPTATTRLPQPPSPYARPGDTSDAPLARERPWSTADRLDAPPAGSNPYAASGGNPYATGPTVVGAPAPPGTSPFGSFPPPGGGSPTADPERPRRRRALAT